MAFWVVAAAGLELARSFGLLDTAHGGPTQPVVVQHLAVASGTLILAWRRRFPLTIAALSATDMLAVGVAMPVVSMQFTMQVAYFFALYSGVAHARDRRHMVLVTGAIVLAMTTWLALSFAVGNALDQYLQDTRDTTGPLSPAVAAVLYVGIINVIYFGGAIWLGQSAWNSARDQARVARQAATIAEQAARLRDQAVVEERLRIARELHDVVAHHVSVMGVQAAGARRLIHADPDRAAAALESVEVSSREAVTQMRALLGTLRSGEASSMREQPSSSATSLRGPQPGLGELPAVVDEARAGGLEVGYTVVGEASGIAAVPPEIGLSIYRTVQEALTNVRRHSTATKASVVVRVSGTVCRGRGPRRRSPAGWHQRHRPRHARHPRAVDLPRGDERDRAEGHRWLPGAGALPASAQHRGRAPVTDASVAQASPIRVLLVDDQHLVRSGFSMILAIEPDIDVVGEAANGQEAVAAARMLHPDVVLMDVQMPGLDGIAATRQIVDADLAKVLILTTFDRDDYVFDGLSAGASGFLLKNADPDQLVDAIRAVAHGTRCSRPRSLDASSRLGSVCRPVPHRRPTGIPGRSRAQPSGPQHRRRTSATSPGSPSGSAR